MTRQEKKNQLIRYRTCMAKVQNLRQDAGVFTASRSSIEQEIAGLVTEAAAIEDAISTLPRLMEREVLLRRYIYGDTLESIADQLNYSVRHLQRISNAAIDGLCL